MPASLYLGLISGTSADAVDAALVDFESGRPDLVRANASPYPAGLRARLLELALGDGSTDLDRLGALDEEVAEQFAEFANRLIIESGVDRERIAAIGSHGQTIWHRPYADLPYTLQLGDPSRIAERTGCRVVADFRRRDLAAGGQGAPLMSAFHAAVLGTDDLPRSVLNLGGIANLTVLPANPEHAVRGFDTGPASCLLDAWMQRHHDEPIDHDGRFAATGKSNPDLLTRLLADPYFALPAPKSTGREVFNLAWLTQQGDGDVASMAPADVQATLVDLTAHSIAQALQREAPETRQVVACGGGVHNPVLMAALRRCLAPVDLVDSSQFGIDPDFVEATGFAWLARQTLAGQPGNLPSVTGARGLRILGGIYAA